MSSRIQPQYEKKVKKMEAKKKAGEVKVEVKGKPKAVADYEKVAFSRKTQRNRKGRRGAAMNNAYQLAELKAIDVYTDKPYRSFKNDVKAN